MLKVSNLFYDQPSKLSFDYPFALLLIENGNGIIHTASNQAELIPGRVFLLKEGCEISFDAELLIGYLIQFRKAMLDYFLFQNFLQRNHGLFKNTNPLPYTDHLPDDILFHQMFVSRLATEYEQHSHLPQHYLLLFLNLVNRNAEYQTLSFNEDEHLLHQLLALIEENFKTHRDIGFYAKKLHINARRVNEITKTMEHRKFSQLLMDRILVEADILLKQNELTIKTISYELGFSNTSHFTCSYIRYKKINPTQFRNS